MVKLSYQDLGQGIFCIDTFYYRPNLDGCYLIQQGDEAALIDTGTSHVAPAVMELLDLRGIRPEQVKYVIPTHVHLDHAGGTGQLMALLPNAQMIIHPMGARHMNHPEKIIAGTIAVYGEEVFKERYGTILPVPEERTIEAEDGFEVSLAGRKLRCIHTLGHARHHFCVWDEQSRGLFTGDTFGISYRELDTDQGPFMFLPSTPIDFDPEAWHASLNRLTRLNPTQLFLTHFCRVDQPALRAVALHEEIDDYVAIALNAGGEQREQQIREGLTRYYRDRLRQHGSQLSDVEIDEVLGMDIALCAQGLEVWLKRREKQQ
ncbi:MAG: MBL fold metallo-hydrolase [Sedimenticola selenatireducens]|uniref:MBL fold metallo-hydrolase n=1 Tax=Sedimenticola selenatireducens TaxID=191960 RepID=A0A2N6CXK3_9GAMM|nr:MAG: MBL fold metallo-hydrolase [Sedimenticola selenatireducens]